LINYFKSYSSLGDDRFLCHPVHYYITTIILTSPVLWMAVLFHICFSLL